MKHLNFLSKSSSRSCGHSSVTLASTVGSQEEFYVSGGNSRGAFTPADVCQTSSVRLNRFTAHRRGTMLKHVAFLLLFLFSFGVGNAWANYTITFKTSGSSSDGSGAQTTIANLISDGDDYVNSISASRAYNGKTGTGVKLGASGGGGSLEMTMKASGSYIGQIKATKLVVTATRYSESENSLKVTVTYTTGSTPTEETLTLSSTSTPYDVTLDATKIIQKIKIETNSTKKRAYCASIQVVEASSKTLSSISVSTAPAKVKYVAGETFDPTDLVITRTYSDKTTDTYAYAGHASDFTFSPSTSTALITSNTSVNISYGDKSTSQTINVYNVTLQAKADNGSGGLENIASGGPGAPTRSGATITAAANSGNYVFKRWVVTNATAASTTTSPTTLSNPTGAVTVTAEYYKPIPVSWHKNGSLYETTHTGYNQKPVFPEDPSSCDQTSNTFYGWATSTWTNTVDNLTGKTVYTSASAMPNVTSAVTYNAVFAKATDNSVPTNVTATFTSKAWADDSSLWKSDDDGDELTSNKGVKVMKEGAGGGTADGTASATTKTSYSSVTSVVVTYSTNSSSGAGSINITVGGTSTTASASVTSSGGTSDRTITYTPTSPATSLTGKVNIAVECTTSSIYVKSVRINYSTGNTTYSKYLTTCCSDPGLAYGTGAVEKTYNDAAFTNTLTNNHGVTVTYSSSDPTVATVNGSGQVTVLKAGTTTITASSIAQTVSTVSYCADEASYTLTVNKANITPTLTYSPNSLTVGNTSAAPTVGGNTGNGTVTYSSSDEDVATVDASTGVVTAKEVGSATITATIAATTNYNGNTATANFTITPSGACATPSFSPVEGTYSTAQSVAISCATDDATIYYTTDGNDPEAIPSNLYAEPIAVSANTTIKALAVKGGMNNSEIGTAVYGIRCAQPTFSPAEGTYNVAQTVTLSAGEGATIYYTTDGNDPEAIPANLYTEPIAVSVNTTIKAIAIVDGMTESEVASAEYELQCLAPTFSPAAGALTGAQNITLSCATDDATIRYTTNNAEPTGSSPVYSTPIQVATATTIKAKAFKEGWTASALATAEYTVIYTVSLNAGTGSVSDAGWTLNQGVYTKTQANAGDALTLPNATLPSNLTAAGWTFAGWKVSFIDAETTAEQSFVSTSYTPTSDITLYAVYKRTATGEEMEFARYEEVTSAPTDWSGKYLLSTGSYTATGVINSSHLTCTALVPGITVQTSYEFTLAKVGDAGYSILLPNGEDYIGHNSGANFATTQSVPETTNTNYLWTPSTSGIVNVYSSDRKIASNSTNTDFRPYQNLQTGGAWVKLYKRIEEAASVTYYHSTPCVALGEFSGSVPQASAEQNQVVLQWTNLSGVTGWSVTYRVKNTGDYAPVTPSATPVVEGNNQWTITGLSTATDYQFKIHADAFGAGYCSNVDEWIVEGRTAEAYTITAQSNDETYGTVVLNNNVITGTPNTNCRYATPAYTISPANSATVSQNGNAFTVDPSANTTVTINFEAIPSHTVTWVMNDDDDTKESYLEGAAIVFPASASGCANKVFKGWLGEEIEGEVDEEPTYVTAATMGTQNLTYYAVFAKETKGTSTTTNDELTRTTTGVTSGSSSYSAWSEKTVTSDAVYAGKSAGGNDAIQLRSDDSDCGIVTTTSGGNATKVTIVWNDNTTDGRTLDVYGKNTAYTAATDLYDNSKKGDKLGSIVYGTSTELTITGNYAFIGLRSSSKAMYLDKVTIEWTNTEPSTYDKYATACTPQVATPTFSGVEANEDCSEVKSVTISCTTPGATIYYTTDGTTPSTNSTEYTTPITLTGGTHTIQAIAVLENYDDSEVASISFTQPYVSIADFIANGSTTVAKKLVLTGAVVLGKSGKNIYVQDATGGIILYNSTASNVPAWASGKAISGYVVGKKGSYQDMPEVTECVFANASATEDGTPTPKTITAAADADLCQLVKIEGVNFQSTALSSSAVIVNKGEMPWTIYDSFNKLSETLPNSATDCDVTGVLTKHDNVYQISPISVDGITTKGALAILPTLSTTGSTNSENPIAVAEGKVITVSPAAGMTSTYKDGTADVADLTSATNVTITAGSDKAIQVTASAYYYTDNSATYYYHPDPTLTEYEISTADMTNGSVTVKNGGDVVGSATSGATITLYPAPIEHYHLTGISVVDASSNEVSLTTVVENEQYTFTMPAKAVTVSATFAEDAYATVTFDKGTEAATGTAPSSFKKYVGQNAVMPSQNTLALAEHTFAGWKYGSDTYNEGEGYTILAEDAAIGGKTITFEAQWDPYPWAGNGKWELVTDASTLAANDYIIVASNADEDALGAQNSNVRNAETIVRNGDKSIVTNIGNAHVLQLKTGNVANSFAFLDVVENKYLAATTGTSNYITASTTITNDASWTISMEEGNDNIAVVQAQGTGSKNLLRSNTQNHVFSCYGSNTSVAKLMLYKFVAGSYFNINYAVGDVDEPEEVSNMPATQVTANDGTATLSSETPIYVGKLFQNWKDEEADQTYEPGANVTLTQNVTLTAQWTDATAHSLSYDINGGTIASGEVPSSTSYYPYAEVTVTSAVLEKEDVIFVGWEYNGDVYGAGSTFEMPNEAVTLTAKFAKGAIYTVATAASVTAQGAPEGSSATFVNTYTSNKEQMTGGRSMTLTLSGYKGYLIKNITLSMHANNNDGAGTFSATVGSQSVASIATATTFNKWYDNTTYGTGYRDVHVAMTSYPAVGATDDIVITIAATTNSLYCQSFTIEYAVAPIEINDEESVDASDILPGADVTINNGGTLVIDEVKELNDITVNSGATVTVNEQLEANNVTVKDGATVTVNEPLVANDMIVENGGKVEITANKEVDVKDFYIGGTHGKSGQVTNAKDLDINGDAYFDFTLGVNITAEGGAAKAADQWHNFSVPFNVDAINGVYGYKEGEWKKLTNEVDYAIEYYHGDLRANGDYGWKKFRGTMTPGHTYSMTVNGDIQTYRFKKSGNDAFAENPTVNFSQHYSSDSKNAGWNGLGNMRLCYSSISNDNIAETTLPGQSSAGRYVLVLDAESYNYVAYLLTNINLTVGSAFFIQASADGNMGFNEAQGGAGKIYAPARTQGKVAEPIMVTMSGERGTDHMYISADEDATSTYQIGRDMQRMFASSNPTTPLIYTMNYGGLKLAAEDAPMVNDQAVYTLQLYAPIAGEYTLQTEVVANADVYLTYQGTIIWNISESEYTVDLNKGKNDGYGLLLRAKAPSTATGVDEINAEAGAQKVIINDHVYILRGGEMFDVTGKAVQ